MLHSKYTTWCLSSLLVFLIGWLVLGNEREDPSGQISSRPKDLTDTADRSRATDAASRQSAGSSKRKMTPMEECIEYGTASPMDTASFSLTEPDGKVSPKALEQAGVQSRKLGEVQKLVDRLWATAARSMKQRMIKNPDKEGNFFLIPSASDEADDLLFQFEQDLGAIVGQASATTLLSGLHPSGALGWFGRYDVEYEVIHTERGIQIRYECYHPENGRKAHYGEAPAESTNIVRMFGPDFKFD